MAKQYPTIQEFLKNCEAADTEDKRLARPKALMANSRLALQLNPRLGGHYLTRATAINAFDSSVKPFDAGDKQRSVEAGQRCKQAIKLIMKRHVQTPFYGSTLYKLQSKNTTIGNALSVIELVKPEYYNFDLSTIYLLDRKSQQVSENIDIAGSANWLLDLEDFFDERGGVLRRIMPVEIIRFDMRLEAGNFLRKLKGILQVIAKNGSGAEEINAAETAARTAIQNNYLITSEMVEFKLNQIAATGSSEAFSSFNEVANADIAIACLGQASTTELPKSGGSRAALQVLNNISADIMWTDLKRVEELINRLLLLDYRLNYNPNAYESEVPWHFTFDITEDSDIEQFANAIETLLRSGVPLKANEVYQRIGFTQPLAGDELFNANNANQML